MYISSLVTLRGFPHRPTDAVTPPVHQTYSVMAGDRASQDNVTITAHTGHALHGRGFHLLKVNTIVAMVTA